MSKSTSSTSTALFPNVYGLGFRFGQFIGNFFALIEKVQQGTLPIISTSTSITTGSTAKQPITTTAGSGSSSSTTTGSSASLHDRRRSNGNKHLVDEDLVRMTSSSSSSLLLHQNQQHHQNHNQQSSVWWTSYDVTTYPALYRQWWINLYYNDPTHVYVETTLLIAIVYFLIASRRSSKQNWKDREKEKLTVAEEEELIQEWKDHIRQPLAPPLPKYPYQKQPQPQQPPNLSGASLSSYSSTAIINDNNISNSSNNNANLLFGSHRMTPVIVHKNNGRLLDVEIVTDDDIAIGGTGNSKERRIVLNFATLDFLGMATDDPIELSTLPPLSTIVPASSSRQRKEEAQDTDILNGTGITNTKIGKSSNKQQKQLKSKESDSDNSNSNNSTNPTEFKFGPINSLDQIKNPMKLAALKALDRYGCGSCGPRGFYGTVDVHLQLEERFAQYVQTDNAILYSDAASTISSTIASFCKRGDLVVVDESCYEPIMTGVLLSRANVKLFKHNDISDLRKVLQQVHDSDMKLGRKPNAQRRFLIVEGLYKNTGSICPLDVVIELKHKFHYRLILDESHSFGTLGPTGKGCMELYGKQLMCDAEIVTISLENALGSIGGMTVGTDEVVDHQRLSGAGYCFSASTPPFTAAAAMEALEIMDHHHVGLLNRLNANREYFYKQLRIMLKDEMEDILVITSDERSPLVMLHFEKHRDRMLLAANNEYFDETLFLEETVRECLRNNGVAFVVTTIGSTKPSSLTSSGSSPPRSSTTNNESSTTTNARIRISITASQTRSDLDHAIIALRDAVDVVMSRFVSLAGSSSSSSSKGMLKPPPSHATSVASSSTAAAGNRPVARFKK